MKNIELKTSRDYFNMMAISPSIIILYMQICIDVAKYHESRVISNKTKVHYETN